MKSSTKRVTIAVVVFVIVAALIGWQVYHTYDRQYAEDRDRIITNITGAASHLTAYGEEMNYDFSDYQQLVGMTQPLTDLAKVNISSSADLKNFYSNLEKSLDGFSSTDSAPSGSQ